MAVLAPFQLGNPISGNQFISSIIIAGCDPSTSNGTYTRSSQGIVYSPDENGAPVVGDATFTGPNSNTIVWDEPRWNLYDTQADPVRQFSNMINNGNLSVTGWIVEDTGTFGTATNIYSSL
jgi:hypothetical protein